MKRTYPLLALAFVFLAGCSKRIDGLYKFENTGIRISVDLRSDGTAVQETWFAVLPDDNSKAVRMGADALTIKNGAWTLSGSRVTVSGKSVLGVDQSNDYSIEPNGDLVETDGNRFRLTKQR